ncbi:NAD-binding protein [Jatrophihabitans telluris]|uniref:NAD-binding protein n=1 Tax=Jatrophihabitans telluris TaxID=2038343 RepID=A0ABY4QY43_9ACTN|nr:NAD-binding protein [Jatrophihabitans telluris]UQX87840.1 NAD-binding protein [Jatrophihabitans telluris]
MTAPDEPNGRAGHVIVCGLTDVALRIIEQLHAAGEQITVLHDAPDPRLTRTVAELGIELLVGDARRPEVLLRAELHTAQALVSVSDADLFNLEVALLVRESAPEVRLVVQLTNQNVARAVERLTGPGSVLDTAALASPAFVEACLGQRDHELVVEHESFLVTERVVERHANLRSAYGDLAPIAVVATDGRVTIAPGRDLMVEPGDRVSLIGSPSDFAERREPAGPGRAVRVDLGGRAPHWQESNWHESPTARLVRRVRRALADIERAFWLSLAALFGFGALSTGVLILGYNGPRHERMTPLDAVYFTTETLTTVGFGDFYFAKQHLWLRMWAIGLMIVGATLVTILYARLTDLLISRRISINAGRRLAEELSGHVILIGLGSVGLRVLEQLKALGRDVVVLERDEDNRYLSIARTLGVPVIIGDSTLRQNLQAANLTSASAVAVLTSNDLANIETGLAVDELLADRRTDVPVVMRVFDRRLAHTLEAAFNFHNVRSPSALAAPFFVGAALGLSIMSTFYVEGQPFLLGRLDITADGGLRGQPMAGLGARIRVIAIGRGGPAGPAGAAGPDGGSRLEHPPRRDTRFEPGDRAYLVGPYEELLQVLGHERGARPRT